mmetsp:Transcript_18893/g.25997  ORF Transcript_18893/g.25997 Transcript_18893/m.25997 type:complete len:93 (-) Transcript_18893:323-601(-)|eukprot:CAMPEP_0185735182 /NCGR_PEP_ID=MMETSP1171-20130828/24524_1 /TAXON_ID=374046 /ORGANISM="Helicotheca tamensis, Strain CCMP826" /LENGTH=92 /DNA_ID=CAMNT_0028405383 /DNA_START=184 /DNA_END=462 /DNA_ORIENTATION=+
MTTSGTTQKRSSSTPPSSTEEYKPTPLQLSLGVLLLGASAGLTLYTKKTSQMLSHLNKMNQNAKIRNPPKYGPPTKQEWEKMRPRMNNDELF